MLDGLLLVTRNDPSIVPLHVLTTRAKPTPEPGEPGFENKVQDILGYRKRCAKINCPSVGFVRSQLCEKYLLKDKFVIEPVVHHY